MNAEHGMNIRGAMRVAIGILVALFFLWLILKQISLSDIRHAFADTRPALITAAVLAFALGYGCRIERWRLMLKQDNNALRWRDCAGPMLASFAVNNVLPFRAGDALRALAFNQELGTASGNVMATLFIERLLDLLVVLIFLGAALLALNIDTLRFIGVSSFVLIGAGALILLALLFPHWLAVPAFALGHVIARLVPRAGPRLLDEIGRMMGTLQHLSKGHLMVQLVTWSLLAWIAEGFVFWLAALSIPAVTAPSGGWLALPVGTLATLIPSTPGYVGTFDYFTARALTETGNAIGPATAFALLVHLLLWLPPTLAGGFYLLLRQSRRHDKLKAANQ